MTHHSTIAFQPLTTEPAAAKESAPIREQMQNELNEQSHHYSPIQFKLDIGAVDDPLEREADTMADTIMRMPEPDFIQRKCAGCEEEVQRKPLASFIQRKGSSPGTIASDTITGKINSGKGSGSNLDSFTQSFMESRFGTDFSNVKIHTNNESIQMNRELNAKAFTVGNDIYFNEGQYNPGSSDGKNLLAHELTHTVQQHSGKMIQRTVKDKDCAVHAYDNSNAKDTAVIPSGTDNNIIGVSSVDDMVTKVNNYIASPDNDCKCVSRLEINGHGTDGYQSVGNGDRYVNDNKALVHDSKDAHLDKLKNIKFCSGGVFLLMGCHTGRGLGKTLLKKVSNRLPGILIGGSQHYTFGAGLGNKKIYGKDDTYDAGTALPFVGSPYVNWHLTIGGKDYVITGADETSSELSSKLKVAEHIKVRTPDGQLLKLK